MTGGAMTRLADWRGRLAAHLADSARLPFAWGRHDCALFAAGCLAAMTGSDPGAPCRGRYRTFRGGRRVLGAAGFADHFALASARLAEVPPAFAQAGDLAHVPGGDGPVMGVVQGHRIYVLRPEGLATVDLLAATRAWRVPS
ncbi:MAG: DUF6950 family protein [Gemmobacter sp.]